ncbi:urea transporter [Congregibacter variabilis]|uniref:Urea transporter n=1 Tax=Congregibacter variabilis TaxID=3081200 RepID=A0ABZ0I6R0_9GAMM|nr:urea transporter [Congregibacter sp. IMCC43200]
MLNDTVGAYAALFFLESPLAGGLLMAATFVFPKTGLSGLAAAIVAVIVTRLFSFPDSRRRLYILNSLLVGLSLGAFYPLDFHLVILIVAGAALAVFASAALADVFWRHERLPVLVIPFLLVAGVTALVAQEFYQLTPPMDSSAMGPSWLLPEANTLFCLLGATFFSVHPVVGAVVLVVMLWCSRYMALLALTAVASGQLIFMALGVSTQPPLMAWAGFNLVLTAIAVGGIYTVPGMASFSTALLAVILTALLMIAFQDLLFVHGLPLIALPYVVVTLIFLVALRSRPGVVAPWLSPQPGIPEQNYERARLARIRNGEVNSVPLLLPVFGRWQIYQGFDGEHTHRAPWQHALDFFIAEGGRSFSGSGAALEDFYCFGLPVLSPVNGQVVRVREHLTDNAPGDVDTKNNWGNFVLIRLDSGLHVLLAHLRQHSVRVKENEWIVPGKLIGSCGNSGRSAQPHVHLQVQRSARLGSATEPFHLCSLLRHELSGVSEYLLNARPKAGDSLEAAVIDPRLAMPLHLPVGRQFTYRVDGSGVLPQKPCQLQVVLTLLGEFRLMSDTGASAAFEEKNGVLAFYDRQGPDDILLDIWLLACGLTPLTGSAHRWRDSPSAQLFPLGFFQRIALRVTRPLGCGVDSVYEREFIADDGVWRQRGQHRLRLGAKTWEATTECLIDPELGCQSISCGFGQRQWRAQLTKLGLASDEGVPGWHQFWRQEEQIHEQVQGHHSMEV